MTRLCIYCTAEKDEAEFSDEHIWPNALGGDFLGNLWRTRNVCARCNSISGVFVDGAFIKSWIGNAERSDGALEYLQVDADKVGRLPLDYLGRLVAPAPPSGCVADCWAGPCGASILHIRPAEDETWNTYAGGDPRAKKARAGRAYMLLASRAPFWIMVSLASFAAHFPRAKKRLVTQGLTEAYLSPYRIETFDPAEEPEDATCVNAYKAIALSRGKLEVEFALDLDLGKRMLCKVALALGCNIFGSNFTLNEGANLRRAFREADPAKRDGLPIKGSGFLARQDEALGLNLRWTGAWVLLLSEKSAAELTLTVVAPSGRTMTTVVAEDPVLLAATEGRFRDGVVWLTIPSLAEAALEIGLSEYLAHKNGLMTVADLARLEQMRGAPDRLPASG